LESWGKDRVAFGNPQHVNIEQNYGLQKLDGTYKTIDVIQTLTGE